MSSCFLSNVAGCHQALRRRTALLGYEHSQARGLTVQRQNCTTQPHATSFRARPTHASCGIKQRGFTTAITIQLSNTHNSQLVQGASLKPI